jgi:hypothetical protein
MALITGVRNNCREVGNSSTAERPFSGKNIIILIFSSIYINGMVIAAE